MSLSSVISADRIHIGFFGVRNAGKSSLVNAVTGQSLAVVSDVKGTTTDPVRKAMELLPLGPVMIIDTPGLDDEGELGQLRVEKTMQTLRRVDLAVVVTDAATPEQPVEKELVRQLEERKIPYLIARNKADLLEEIPPHTERTFYVSAAKGIAIDALKEAMGRLTRPEGEERTILSDLVEPADTVVLVVPIDKAAPKGRLILPQQQTIRELLDCGASALVCRDRELSATLQALQKPPKLVITDSQVFGFVGKTVPQNIPLTSFSILFARYKGSLEQNLLGVAALDHLKEQDRVLICEGCTHHRQCDDIGTVKLPNWLREYVGGELTFEFTSGADFPEDLSPYKLIIHCGGCMLQEKEIAHRYRLAAKQGVPITNYGIAIAKIHGILERSLSPFPTLQTKLQRWQEELPMGE